MALHMQFEQLETNIHFECVDNNRPFAQIVVGHDFELFTCLLDYLHNKS